MSPCPHLTSGVEPVLSLIGICDLLICGGAFWQSVGCEVALVKYQQSTFL